MDLPRLKRELESRRATLRVEVKTQLDGSDDDRVMGLRNRIKESGDEWGVADGMAELDIAEVRHALTRAGRGRRRARPHARAARTVSAAIAASRSRRPGSQPIRRATRCVACQERYERKLGGPPVTAGGRKSARGCSAAPHQRPRAGPPGAKRFTQSKNSRYHSREFCGFRIQWFSSGKYTSRAGTFFAFSVS